VYTIDQAPLELAEAIREFWPAEEWDHAASVARLESGWNPFAEADTTQAGNIPCTTVLYTRDGVAVTAEDSIGWFQLNACNFPTWNRAHFFNSRHNAGTAHMLWSMRGWQPWYFSAKSLGLL
jgi:hypothetical protein